MKPYVKLIQFICPISLCILLFTSCMKEESVLPQNEIDERGTVMTASGTTASSSSIIYGLSPDNRLVTFRMGPPVTAISSVEITGLKTDEERIVAIDIRPTTAQLYGISDKSMLYTINTTNGTATAVSTQPFSQPINGSMVGFDFSVKPDAARIVTDMGQNMTIDPRTGTIMSVDQNISPDFLKVGNIAYSNTTSSTTTSGGNTLYDLNTADGKIYVQYGAKGATSPLVSTGLAITGDGGFDIAKDGTTAVAFLNAQTVNGVNNSTISHDDTSILKNRLYSINLRTGAATSYGPVDSMIGIAMP